MTSTTSAQELDALLTPAEVSHYLGVPVGTLANWRYQSRGPAFLRVGRHVRYRTEDLAAWVQAQLAENLSRPPDTVGHARSGRHLRSTAR